MFIKEQHRRHHLGRELHLDCTSKPPKPLVIADTIITFLSLEYNRPLPHASRHSRKIDWSSSSTVSTTSSRRRSPSICQPSTPFSILEKVGIVYDFYLDTRSPSRTIIFTNNITQLASGQLASCYRLRSSKLPVVLPRVFVQALSSLRCV